jgi:hypothetical protein
MEFPPEPVVRAVIQRYAALMARLGREIGDRPLVLPTSEFFPDTFTPDEKSLRRLVKRMRKHAGMRDVPIRGVLLDADGQPHESGSCSTGGGGGCGSCAVASPGADAPPRLVDEGDGWRLQVTEPELGHAVVLTANVARSLGYVFLFETCAERTDIEAPIELSVDLAAVALGFGELLLEGSYIYQKSCGGPSVARVTALGPGELSLAAALFVALGDHSPRALASELPVTQRAAFDEAWALVDSNPDLVRALGSDPARVASGDFSLAETKPWLSRVFGKKKKKAEAELSLDELEALVASTATVAPRKRAAPDPKRDELRALVDEAFEQS